MTEFGPPEAGVKACEMCACYCIIPTPIQEVQGWENPRKGQLAWSMQPSTSMTLTQTKEKEEVVAKTAPDLHVRVVVRAHLHT